MFSMFTCEQSCWVMKVLSFYVTFPWLHLQNSDLIIFNHLVARWPSLNLFVSFCEDPVSVFPHNIFFSWCHLFCEAHQPSHSLTWWSHRRASQWGRRSVFMGQSFSVSLNHRRFQQKWISSCMFFFWLWRNGSFFFWPFSPCWFSPDQHGGGNLWIWRMFLFSKQEKLKTWNKSVVACFFLSVPVWGLSVSNAPLVGAPL